MDRVESVEILGNEDSLASERLLILRPVEGQQGSFFEAFSVVPAYDLATLQHEAHETSRLKTVSMCQAKKGTPSRL